jgi:hypothetical protein
MNTTKIFTTLKVIGIAIVLSVGLSYAAIQDTTWNPGVPMADNVDVPINRTDRFQEKKGALSVNTFAALGDGQLMQQAFFRGTVKGIDVGSTDPTLEIGGTSTNGSSRRVVTTVYGDWNSGQTIGSTELRNTTLQRLCSEEDGRVVLCGQAGGGGSEPVIITGTIGTSTGRNSSIQLNTRAPAAVTFPFSARFLDNGAGNPSVLHNLTISIPQSGQSGTTSVGNASYVCTVASQIIGNQGTYIYDTGSVSYRLTVNTYCP